MKKNLLYLFTVLCTLSFFTSCGDDDEKPNEDWKNISKAYTGESLKVTGGANGNVEVKATSDKAATIVLTNVVPDAATVNIDAALAGTNISGEATVNGCLVKVAGAIDSKGALALTVTREITSPVVGDWKLNIATVDNTTAAQVLLVAKTGNAQMDGLISGMGGPMLGQIIAKKVNAVTAKLGANGTVAISWTPIDTLGVPQKEVAMPAALGIQYCIVKDQLMIVFDKAMMTMLAPILTQAGIDATKLLPLLTDMGGYYGYPLNMKIEGNTATFFLSKEHMIAALPVLTPILTPIIPKELQELVGGILALIPTAQQFDLGLVFSK